MDRKDKWDETPEEVQRVIVATSGLGGAIWKSMHTIQGAEAYANHLFYTERLNPNNGYLEEWLSAF